MMADIAVDAFQKAKTSGSPAAGYDKDRAAFAIPLFRGTAVAVVIVIIKREEAFALREYAMTLWHDFLRSNEPAITATLLSELAAHLMLARPSDAPSRGCLVQAVPDTVVAFPSPIALPHVIRVGVASRLAGNAATSAKTPQRYFLDLVRRAPLPEGWKREAGAWDGGADDMALQLVDWVVSKGRPPERPECNALAWVLATAMETHGLDDRTYFFEIIARHGDLRDANWLDQLKRVMLTDSRLDGPTHATSA
jgi:hypothetical protein